ncbi:MAG: universal stress protein [Rhodopirellula sp.]|nr:universal stress protein [Rhodopirellula sp.]
MRLMQTVLVAIDFRTGIDDVLAAASALGRTFQSEMLLLNVLPPAPDGFSDAALIMELARERSLERLNELASKLRGEGARVAEPIVAEGSDFECILREANERDANVIVIARSAGGDDPSALGLTAERVLRHSAKPVWVVKPGQPVSTDAILCAVDFSAPSRRALGNAVHLARNLDSKLTVLTVIQPVSTFWSFSGLVSQEAQHAYEEDQRRRFEAFLAQFDFHNVRWEREVRVGDPPVEILAAAEKSAAKLLVMGSGAKTGFTRILLGHVTGRVATAMPCSLLSFKAESAIRLRIEEEIADMQSHFKLGEELLEKGLAEEARRQFQHCIETDRVYAPAWEGLAEAYRRLGDSQRAEECSNTAKQIVESLWWRQVEADIRGHHPLWRGKTPWT